MNDLSRPPILPFTETDEERGLLEAPEWSIAPSPFDWQVLIYGGENPRTGFEQPPLEFQFFAKFYSPRDIRAKAADLAEREHRTHFVIREPTDRRFMRRAG